MINKFYVDEGWFQVLKKMGLEPADLLREALLEDDLFSRKNASLSTAEYFRLWHVIEAAL